MEEPISTTMPTQRQRLYVVAYGLFSLIFVGLGVFLEIAAYHSAPAGAHAGVVDGFVTILVALIALAPVGLLMRYACKIVREYSYDGRALSFKTLCATHARVELSTEVLEVRRGGGRSPGFGGGGYWICFRNGETIYFEQRLPSVEALVERLRPGI